MITALLLVLAQAAAATPAPVPTQEPASLSGGFGQKAAPKKSRVVITDYTLTPTGRGGTLSVAGASSVAPAGTPAAGKVGPAASDDESAWRGRASALRADISAAVDDLARAEAANPVILGGRPGYMVEVGASARNAALSPYRVRLGQLKSELAALPEECRRTSGCQPGWVR